MADKLVPEAPSPAVAAAHTHIVRVGRDKSFTSDTLAGEHLAPMEAAFRAARWWRDRWKDRGLRGEARRVLREQGGLVLIGPGVNFDVPPPFGEFFEAIEISGGSQHDNERLKAISGEKPTRSERIDAVLWRIAIAVGVLMVAGLVIAYLMGMARPVLMIIAAPLLGTVLVMLLIGAFVGLGTRYFLVPGGVAVVRRSARRGRPPRITVFSRGDSCLVFRLVSTGKTVILVMELWTHLGKIVRRVVSDRAAMSVLAVWRSRQPPLEDDRLEALLHV